MSRTTAPQSSLRKASLLALAAPLAWLAAFTLPRVMPEGPLIYLVAYPLIMTAFALTFGALLLACLALYRWSRGRSDQTPA